MTPLRRLSNWWIGQTTAERNSYLAGVVILLASLILLLTRLVS